MTELTQLPNIGAVLAEKLTQAGIHSHSDLAALGSIKTIIKIGETTPPTCYNMLYALEGAIQKIRWHAIPKEERALLKAEFDQIASIT